MFISTPPTKCAQTLPITAHINTEQVEHRSYNLAFPGLNKLAADSHWESFQTTFSHDIPQYETVVHYDGYLCTNISSLCSVIEACLNASKRILNGAHLNMSARE